MAYEGRHTLSMRMTCTVVVPAPYRATLERRTKRLRQRVQDLGIGRWQGLQPARVAEPRALRQRAAGVRNRPGRASRGTRAGSATTWVARGCPSERSAHLPWRCPTMRICTDCSQTRPLDEFLPIRGTPYVYGRCRECRNERARDRYRASPEIHAAEIARSWKNTQARKLRRRLKAK
jgi:hypothetical protein